MALVRKPTGIYWARGTDPNTMPIPVLVIDRFVLFAVSTGTGDKDPYTQWAHGEYIVGTDNT